MSSINLAILAFSAILFASITVNETYLTIVPDSCKDIVGINQRYIWLPGEVSDFFDGKTINLEFDTIKEKKIFVWGKVDEHKIGNLECGQTDDYDYFITMRDVDALNLATSIKPITIFERLWSLGYIKIKANGEENKKRLDDGARTLAYRDNEPVPESIREFFARYVEKNR